MAINEACQVWIEQRIQEELEERGDTEKSFRAIGRELAAEIERLFEAKVNPRSIEKRAERSSATNVAPTTTTQNNTQNTVDTVDKLTTPELFDRMAEEIKGGKSVRDAAKIVAPLCGKSNAATVRAYSREKVMREYRGDASDALDFAEMAILQLERIQPRDPKRQLAFRRVEKWLKDNMEKGQ